MKFNFDLPDELLDTMDDFQIEREGIIISSAKGFFCGKDYPSTIQLAKCSDVKSGDWLIHSASKNRYFAKDAQPLANGNQVSEWMVPYIAESERLKEQQNKTTTSINIGSVNGSAIIGSQQNATLNAGCSVQDIAQLIATKPGADLTELCELVSELKKLEKLEQSVPKGCLSKFSDTLKKHSDLLVALGGWAVQLLIGK